MTIKFHAFSPVTAQSTPTIHVFEAKGLGKAPFKLEGVTVGHANCQFCATGISYQYHIVGIDGSQFFVGSDCVMKTGDTGLIRKVEFQVRKLKRDQRHANEKKKIDAIKILLQENEAFLKNKPHPGMAIFYKNSTLFEYYTRTFNRGNAAIIKMGKMLKKVLEPGYVGNGAIPYR
jgi:hypothetical protein